ncbi:resolvase domain-containing protein (plasmid) [Acetobacter pasteurianus NBRC 101655]|uniref:Transposase n=2 Tax=Acetobacter TaxID=434 RepID=A0A2G4R9G8_9PROT|nr:MULTISPECIES: recombinase family protein [Acetobacter]BAU39778.1 resolvase domain-containing protein [Acetobacter pasteurianus NBRC 101655]ANA15307.1 transposase [Acetobacter oryzifermentans]PHY93221.1 transposase [Acetobacter pomorum]CCT60947.1 resolvase domain-containing protein [Acetobacter pasteurianus 386B]GBR52871.1 DNA resolvase [Acetobacter pomorum DSM 11825]
MSRKVGYARVSTVGQTLDVQFQSLQNYGCAKIFREKASGADSERIQLQRLLRNLSDGETVVVTRIDRLARSTFDLFAIIKEITQRGAQFFSIAEPWADTTTSTGRLMLAVLGGLADVERDLIKTRTAEGRIRAARLGVKMGRPARITKLQQQEIKDLRQSGATLKELALEYEISTSTVSRIATGTDSHSSRKHPKKEN